MEIGYAVQSNVIRSLTQKEYQVLTDLCRYSNNLYNFALYNIRQYFFTEKKFFTYESNYHVCKTNENYKLIQAGVSQQILKVVDRSFKSFFNLLKKCKMGDYRFHDVKIPYYRKKGGLFSLILSTNAINIRDGFLQVPLSQEYRNSKNFHNNIKIPFPQRLEGKKIKEVRIRPYGSRFKIDYVYEVEQQIVEADKNNYLAIDIGVENLATCVSNVETPFIMDGRKLKSINQYWNKEKARLQSIANKQNLKTTRRIESITQKRNNRVNDGIKKTVRYIINNCIENKIGNVVVGYNKDFKRFVDIGKTNNQNFVQIPFGKLREQLSFLCWLYGIDYVEVEESYTSKSSFLDLDSLPEYNPENPFTGKFSGSRIKRGLYRSKDGTILNADVNGAYNILRKSKQNFRKEELCPGGLESPVRIRLS